MAPLVHTIILTWDNSRTTPQCLAALARQTYPNHRTLLVDNGSTPPAVAPPGVTLVRLPHNQGFAGGVNAGIQAALAAGAAYVWLLNDDAEALPDTLAQLVAAAESDPAIGIVSPVIRNADDHGRPAFTAGRIDLGALTFHYADTPETAALWAEQTPAGIWVTGTAMLLRRELLEQIGGFDESLFAYWEDNDICLRAIRAGFRAVMVPDAAVLHPHGPPGATAARPPYFHYYMARNQLLLIRKNGGLAANPRALLWALLGQARDLARLPRDAAARRRALRQGVWHGLTGVTGPHRPPGPLAPALGQAALTFATLLARLRPARR